MYKEIISAGAKNQIKRLPEKVRKAVIAALIEFKVNPYIGSPLSRELTGKYKYREGVYRIIYKIRKKERIVEILRVEHRKMVYN